jgi:hypothetical protein
MEDKIFKEFEELMEKVAKHLNLDTESLDEKDSVIFSKWIMNAIQEKLNYESQENKNG